MVVHAPSLYIQEKVHPEVARKHYLQITDTAFDKAVHEITENADFSRVSGSPKVPSSGFEPPTYGLGNRRSIP